MESRLIICILHLLAVGFVFFQEVKRVLQVLPQPWRVQLQSATKYELMLLDGIGEILADRIVEYRKEHSIASVDELIAVHGIRATKIERMMQEVARMDNLE